MNGIILQWLQSEPMGEAWSRAVTLLPAAILLCGLLLAACIWGKRRKCRGASARQPYTDDGSITQELPVAAVAASAQDLNTLTDILYCESEEIIP